MSTRSHHDWIRELQLEPHPEGGWYREVYRSPETIAQSALPGRFQGDRAFSTAIYFLLGPGDVSTLHRIQQDELWHLYDGGPLTIHTLTHDGTYEATCLGADLAAGQRPMAAVAAGVWFGATVDEPDGYALLGCTVAPGFDFADFELATRDQLAHQFPQHRELIERLTPIPATHGHDRRKV